MDDDGDRRSSWADEAVLWSETGLTESLWGWWQREEGSRLFFPSAGEKEGNKWVQAQVLPAVAVAVAAQCRGDCSDWRWPGALSSRKRGWLAPCRHGAGTVT